MIKKIISIVGARPQFIKAAIVSKRLKEVHVNQLLLHTGQHYDSNMSAIFFKDLKIDTPDFYLGIGSGQHGEQTGNMLVECEKVLLKEKPCLAVVYGDTNSTLAGALSAIKLKIPVAHVEAGLRSYKRYMPEEINRVLTDHISELLFAPTSNAVNNLKKESIVDNVFNVGDVMLDLALEISSKMESYEENILKNYNLRKKQFILITVHRADNTDIKNNLFNIYEAIKDLANKGYKIFFPVHPRTRNYLINYAFLDKKVPDNLILNEPISYNEMIVLEKNARVIITDSGGVQKEAYFFKTPAIIPRDKTEWVEIVRAGWNILTGADKQRIVDSVLQLWDTSHYNNWKDFYGNGNAGNKIANIIKGYI